jgi:ABC-type glycerol-3-phosphate transport system substrate-binding protein
MQRAAFALAAAMLAGCGGGDQESASAAWCNTTGRIVYLLDQHSTTLTLDEIGEWEESAPEKIRSNVAEAYADGACPEGWRGAFPRPSR